MLKQNFKVVKVSPKKSDNRFIVSWNNLSYSVNLFGGLKSLLSKKSDDNQKLILNHLNGFFQSGQLTALMGPSGSGKSTLFECLVGLKKTGVRGSIRLNGIDKVIVGMVPQFEHFIDNLSVDEIMTFSCRLLGIQNNQQQIIDNVLDDFGLTLIRNTRINRCSGGQQKRVSIAIEVLAKPNILFLDEPTTGLDSQSCLNVIKIMLKLVKNKDHPMAIITTIHQPSYYIFSQLNWLYILSKDGRCIYQGKPDNLLPTLSMFQLNCQKYNSPADYLIEISCGDYGTDKIDQLSKHQVITNEKDFKDRIRMFQDEQDYQVTDGPNYDNELVSKRIKRNHSSVRQFIILLNRMIKSNYRNKVLVLLRIIFSIISGAFIGLLYSKDDGIGKMSGCFPGIEQLYTTDLLALTTQVERNAATTIEAVSLMFLNIFLTYFISISPVLVSLPSEMRVFARESINGWYSSGPYYLARFICDIPLQLICSTFYILLIYNLAGFPPTVQRELMIVSVFILFSLDNYLLGLILGTQWFEHPIIPVVMAATLVTPLSLSSGYVLKADRMPWYIRPLTWISYWAYSYSLEVINSYGFKRCYWDEMKYHEYLLSQNITDVEPPQWVKGLPFIQRIIDVKRKEKNLEVYHGELDEEDYDEIFSDPKKKYLPAIKRIFNSVGKAFVGDSTDFDMGKSFILYTYRIDDDQIYKYFAGLLITMTVFMILFYVLLRRKVNFGR